MKFLSLSSILTLVFLIYIGNTLWSLKNLFTAPVCGRGQRCLSSYLSDRPTQHLVLYTSVSERPNSDRVTKLHTVLNFDYSTPQHFDVELAVPSATRNNGTLYLHVAMLDESKLYRNWDEVRAEPLLTLPLVSYAEPLAATFNLLNQKDDSDSKKNTNKNSEAVMPIAHINTQVEFSILADDIRIPVKNVPDDLYPYLRLSYGKFLPIMQHNILKSRIKNLKLIDKKTRSVNMTVSYSPVSFGLWRLMLHVRLTLTHLHSLGFGEKDVDDVKGIFADTNLYLLSATIIIASCHLLFDILAFKNDVSFWRQKKSMAGVSGRTVLWRSLSQCVILLYLIDENTSLLVLIPCSISTIIDMWKVKKVLRVNVSWRGWTRPPRLSLGAERNSQAERRTRDVDAEAMRYLSYLLYPLCLAGAVYSLLYEPHKSWYSWSLHSLVNGVYAFGFLLMLPQLFVNYRLRSVAALPWRAFMYKAFNTFIDDVFAFIITMPTAHRVACFRDDVVFLIYLYQRWLYPVDEHRTDDATSMHESAEETAKTKKE